ncbi:hypothetical protein N7462_001115 [Penicillium macrosclerotiorum]|uniref:uncharacterized protein n=1 Tax=Penicillium macrosclerotiorum TaxID=303699 RepID=UPI002546CE33|nr:uncharacterized protein N7462_001115 [Penicillium macrosclerotiorum]KAJ5699110.1 hypothetical protein N7462_001115 [Penicillium macrosclerotiorum]
MESLSETPWDVVIAGTGLAQSLLALALSRSGKKVLHVDRNPYYGGSEAAFSLDEASEWMDSVNQHPGKSSFEDAKIVNYPHLQDPPRSPPSQTGSQTSELPQSTLAIRPKLAASRAYTLSLSPYFLYTRSELISILLSSKIYRQLEFMAVGSWWIYSSDTESGELGATQAFHRVPGNREDIFADTHISMKSKRVLMRFLRQISKSKDEEDGLERDDDLQVPFADYLSSNFSVPEDLHYPLLSLSLSQMSHQNTAASYALSRIKRHLASIGALGPGFGGVVSKYGGASEIVQVACRASAVGGGIYALDTGIQSLHNPESVAEAEHSVTVQLSNGESVRTKFVVGSFWDLPLQTQPSCTKVARSITIASSDFASLFPVTVEGAPVPASAILMFSGDSLNSPQSPPVYLQVHSSDTGDCPRQQSVIYGSIALPGRDGHHLLECAVGRLLRAEGPQAIALWSMRYSQLGRLSNDGSLPSIQTCSPHVLAFPPPSLDLALEDDNIDIVKQAWVKIVGDEVAHEDFMIFDDREGTSDD